MQFSTSWRLAQNRLFGKSVDSQNGGENVQRVSSTCRLFKGTIRGRTPGLFWKATQSEATYPQKLIKKAKRRPFPYQKAKRRKAILFSKFQSDAKRQKAIFFRNFVSVIRNLELGFN